MAEMSPPIRLSATPEPRGIPFPAAAPPRPWPGHPALPPPAAPPPAHRAPPNQVTRRSASTTSPTPSPSTVRRSRLLASCRHLRAAAAMRCCCRPARRRSSWTQQRPADDPRWPAQPRAARSRRGRDAAIAWSRTLARVGAGRYNARMRRPTRLGLAVVVLLIAILGAYGAFWFVVAGRLEDGVTQWAQSLRAQNLDMS